MAKKIQPTLESANINDASCRECRRKDKIISRLTRTTDPKTPQQKYYDEKWLAVRWGSSVKTIQKMRYERTGPKVTLFGRSVRYRLRDVQAFERAAGNTNRF